MHALLYLGLEDVRRSVVNDSGHRKKIQQISEEFRRPRSSEMTEAIGCDTRQDRMAGFHQSLRDGIALTAIGRKRIQDRPPSYE